MNLAICDPENHHITITPTIPVRGTVRGLPKISFHAPPEVDILQDSCEVELAEGIKPMTITIKAACERDVTEGLKPIIPRISTRNSRFWSHKAGLPTIWVCISIYVDMKFSKIKMQNVYK